MNNKSGGLLGLILFMGLFFTGFWYVSSAAHDMDMTINETIAPTNSTSVTENWTSDNYSRTYSGGCQQTSDNGTLFVAPGDSCTWTSNYYNVSNDSLGLPATFSYIGDAASGELEATITTYDKNQAEVESQTYVLDSGARELDIQNDFNTTPVYYLDVSLLLDENNQNEDHAPAVDEYTLEWYEEKRVEKVGLTDRGAEMLTIIVFVSVGILFIVAVYD